MVAPGCSRSVQHERAFRRRSAGLIRRGTIVQLGGGVKRLGAVLGCFRQTHLSLVETWAHSHDPIRERNICMLVGRGSKEWKRRVRTCPTGGYYCCPLTQLGSPPVESHGSTRLSCQVRRRDFIKFYLKRCPSPTRHRRAWIPPPWSCASGGWSNGFAKKPSSANCNKPWRSNVNMKARPQLPPIAFYVRPLHHQ